MAGVGAALRSWLVLAWLCCLHLTAIGLFGAGFFLTRRELPASSACEQPPPDSGGGSGSGTVAGCVRGEQTAGRGVGCWMPPRYDKAIVVVIDALRFDFVAPVSPAAEAALPAAERMRSR